MNSREIKKWLIDQDLRQADIGRALNISREAVNQVINNRNKNARVLRWLLDNGCPQEFLDKDRNAA